MDQQETHIEIIEWHWQDGSTVSSGIWVFRVPNDMTDRLPFAIETEFARQVRDMTPDQRDSLPDDYLNWGDVVNEIDLTPLGIQLLNDPFPYYSVDHDETIIRLEDFA